MTCFKNEQLWTYKMVTDITIQLIRVRFGCRYLYRDGDVFAAISHRFELLIFGLDGQRDLDRIWRRMSSLFGGTSTAVESPLVFPLHTLDPPLSALDTDSWLCRWGTFLLPLMAPRTRFVGRYIFLCRFSCSPVQHHCVSCTAKRG